MTFKRTFPKPTKDQQIRQDKCRLRGCLACHMEGVVMQCGHPEIHHLTVSGRQIGQDETICLGSWHHRSICIPGYTSSQMTENFGPSLAKGSKTFHAKYGNNDSLLAVQNSLVKE